MMERLAAFKSALFNLAKDSRGATAIEYGLIAALVSVAIIAALQLLGTELGAIFNDVESAMDSARTSN